LFGKIIIPHAQKKKYSDRTKQTLAEIKDQGLEFITLTDDQAVIVTDRGSRVVNRQGD